MSAALVMSRSYHLAADFLVVSLLRLVHPSSVMFPSIACKSCAIDVSTGAWHHGDGCSGHFN